ncbi:MAG: hypothetical protein ICV77_05415 [Cyanobacteria bacterium Co-bin8]|nr:hypothetical protein [Cyanobacteria bacterium Co-bin8]
MATPRLLTLLLLLVAIGLLAWQNPSPAVPLRFLGLQTQPYPLAVWLVGAIALGSLSTVFLSSLMTMSSGAGPNRRSPNRFGRRIPYDPTTATSGSAEARTASGRSPEPRPSRPEADGEWGEWTNLRSPGQWEDWSDRPASSDRPSDRPSAPSSAQPNRPSWWGRNRAEAQTQQVNESWQEISDGWNELEDMRYRARGVSPVEDALDDLDEGWDEAGNSPRRDFEVGQSPKRVHRDGSIYSYSYREPEHPDRGRADDVYGPPDEDAETWEPPQDRRGMEWVDPGYAADEAADDNQNPEDLRDPKLGPDGVVDADFRVIVPPYRPLEITPNSGSDDDDEDWVGEIPER